MSRLFHTFSGRLYHFNTIYKTFYDQIESKIIYITGSVVPDINGPREFLFIAVANLVGLNGIHFLFHPDVPNSLIKHIKKMDADDLTQIYRIVIQYYLYFCLVNNEKLRPEIDKELVLKNIYKLIEVDNDDFNKFCTYMDKWEDTSKKPISQWDPFVSIAMSMGTKWSEETAGHIFAAITIAIKQTRDLEKPFNAYIDILEYRKDTDKIRQSFVECVDGNREDRDVAVEYYNKGVVLVKQSQQIEEAIKMFDKALEINPQFTEAYFSKGIALKMLGKYEEALKVLNKANEVNSELAK